MGYVYLLITLRLTVTVASSRSDLPEIIYEICPYSDICNRTASKALNVEGLVPCCASCKCDDQCGLRLDCCFDDMDKYRLENKGIVACFNPIIGEERLVPLKDGYWMIQTCTSVTENDLQNKSKALCKLNNARGLSFIEPVSSRESDSIYVNKECAKCNNVYTFTQWNYWVFDKHRNVGPSVWESKNDIESNEERIVYIPPPKEDWSIKRCLKKPRNTCNTNSKFRELCQTLKMPFQQERDVRYDNPFCLLCGNYNSNAIKECKDEHSRGLSTQFTVIIDNSVVEYSKLRKIVMTNKSLKPDCLTKTSVVHSDACFPIYCPNGMLMTQTGCRYFIHIWYIPSFRIQFKLWAMVGNEVPIAFLNALTQEERNDPLRWMKMPCPKVQATATEVLYEIDKNGKNTVKSFIVRLFKLTPDGVDPSILFPRLSNCLKYNWYLYILGETYTFYPTLDKHSVYVQDGLQMRFNKLTKEKEDAPRSKTYERIATGLGPLSSFTFTHTWDKSPVLLKTFFCDQVRLTMEEVEVLYGEMRLLSKNVTLGNGEFEVNYFQTKTIGNRYITDLNKTTFSVCLEDYDHSYYKRHAGSAMSLRAFLFEQLVIYYVLSQFII